MIEDENAFSQFHSQFVHFLELSLPGHSSEFLYSGFLRKIVT